MKKTEILITVFSWKENVYLTNHSPSVKNKIFPVFFHLKHSLTATVGFIGLTLLLLSKFESFPIKEMFMLEIK